MRTLVDPSGGAGYPSSPLGERLRAAGIDGDIELDSARLATVGLTDGLLVVPPTPSRVDRYLEDAGVHQAQVRAIPLAMAPPSLWDLGACAVMAGCRPASFPFALAALEALTTPEFNLLGVQTTTSGVAPLLVISRTPDPANHVLDTLAIGRAVRLALHALGNALPGVSNLSTQGHPGKVSWCIAESADSPWAPVHDDRLEGVQQAVTAIAAVGSVEAVLGQAQPDDDVALLARACAAVRAAGLHARVARRQVVVVVPPEVAHRLAAAGWDRRRLSADLARRTDRLLSPSNGAQAVDPDTVGPLGAPDVTARSGDVLLVVSGGIGIKGTVVQTWGSGNAISAPVR